MARPSLAIQLRRLKWYHAYTFDRSSSKLAGHDKGLILNYPIYYFRLWLIAPPGGNRKRRKIGSQSGLAPLRIFHTWSEARPVRLHLIGRSLAQVAPLWAQEMTCFASTMSDLLETSQVCSGDDSERDGPRPATGPVAYAAPGAWVAEWRGSPSCVGRGPAIAACGFN